MQAGFVPIFLLYVLCLVIQSCLILCDTMAVARQAPLPMGIPQARMLVWVVMPFSRGSSQPRDRTQVSYIGGRFFTIWATSYTMQEIKHSGY